MKIPREELVTILSKFNPWWRQEKIPDLPKWQRVVFQDLMEWIEQPPVHRAIMLSGARQVGKTTLLLQAIQRLTTSGISPANILYVTFDHPICKLAGIDRILEVWREIEPRAEGIEYIFLDEAQFVSNIGTWIKHQVDFFKYKRIVFTGSATPLIHTDQESGVGRWHTIGVSTLSFYEYLQIRATPLKDIPLIPTLSSLFSCSSKEYYKMSEATTSLIGHFHEYLIRGGFPQTVLVESITQAQRLLREDILEKILRRDMTVLFGVRRVAELEQMFVFLCMHDGGMRDITTIAKNLGVVKQTVQNFIDLFVSTHLVYKLPPFGYGKEVLRGKHKLYLSDPAIGPAVLMKGKSILEDPLALSQCIETATINHLSLHCRSHQARFSYWRNSKDKEVDFIVEIANTLLPFEIKYQTQEIGLRDIPGMLDLCKQKPSITHSYILTKSPQDIGLLSFSDKKLMRIPASLFCYWLGATEATQNGLSSHQLFLS